MCGIAGIHRRTDSKIDGLGRLADGLLLAIVHRGTDATGVATITDEGAIKIDKAVRPAQEFVLTRDLFPAAARTVLLHTRFATRGRADDPNNAHPVKAGKCVAVHNGTIYNDAALFRRHRMKRTADVDSVVIPALVSKMGWAKADKALGQLDGGAATAVIHRDHPTEVVLARTKTYPLHVFVTDELVVWASERQAITLAWRYAFREFPPTTGAWIEVPPYTVLRVNGKLTSTPLPQPRPAKITRPYPGLSKGKAKRARRGGKGATSLPTVNQLALNAAPPPTEPTGGDGPEPWMLDEVRDLMRWADCDYDEAYEAVMGVSPPDDDIEWIDDIATTTGGGGR